MKIQCSCGTKYAFEITPDMIANPVQLVCQSCGADNSAAVNQIICQQFGATVTQSAPPPKPIAVVMASQPVPVPAQAVLPQAVAVAAAPAAPRLQVKLHTASATTSEPAADATASAPKMCLKHPGQFSTDQCRVCGKPICPQCMALFGYVCSSFCKNEAEQRRIDLPVYQNQTTLITKRRSGKIGLVIGSTCLVLALFLGTYLWYRLIGSHPRVIFSRQFATPAYSGGGKLIGQEAVLLHGGHLARYDLKSKKEIWSADLIDMTRITAEAEEALAKENEAREQWIKEGRVGADVGYVPPRHTKDEFIQMFLSSAQSEFTLHVHEENIWLRSRDKLVQYEWATGKPGREVLLKGYVERTVPAKDSLLIFSSTDSGEELTKLDFKSGETQTQTLSTRRALVSLIGRSNRAGSVAAALSKTNKLSAAAALALARTNAAMASARGAPANPALKGYKVQQPDPLPRQIAAPAIAATAVRNAQIDRALKEDEDIPVREFDSSRKQFLNDHGNLVEFSVKLLESKVIERQAMKAPPKKSTLEGEVNQAATLAIANEIMNDFQRDLTGGIEREDASRYEVSIKRTGPDAGELKMEVIGPPEFFPMNTVDLLVAGKTLIVLDKASKKLWESKLNFGIAGGFGDHAWIGALVATANAPAVERENLLYFFDQGVLACFELANGNVRWRQPTVGVTKLLFDEEGMLYADTTTGSADSLKYSQQIDISQKNLPVILKIDPKTGKTLWRSQQNGRLSHVFGKLIYTMEWNGGDEDEKPGPYSIGLEIPPHIRIRRLSPGNGKPVWEYYQKRAPINVDIQGNTIQLVFKKEMQVLKFMTL